jgi:tetratricopeptide (TPR) repeat protein
LEKFILLILSGHQKSTRKCPLKWLAQLGLGYSRKGDHFWNIQKDTQKGGEYYTQSAQFYEKAMEDPNCKGATYSNYAVLFFQNGQRLRTSGREVEARADFEKARENYEIAVQRQPNYPEGWMNLGSAYGMLGNHTKAAECFNKALEYDPENAATIYTMLSIAYENLGQAQKASQAMADAERQRALGKK